MLLLTPSTILAASFFAGIFAILFALHLTAKIKKEPAGNKKMQEISELIHKGSMAFLNKEYKVMLVFTIAIALLLYFTLENGAKLALAFLTGCIFSALAGRLGMYIATKANVRTAWACTFNIGKALRIAFSSGAVMGMFVVGLGVFGISVFYFLFNEPNLIFGFGFGASYIALFARVAGGIYTKAADVGADLVGKIEKGIPEDDPRNPAVIADNVGDNVGDVAGMGADLFESYVESIIAAMVIGFIAFNANKDYVLLPLAISSLGILASIIGTFFVRAGDKNNVTSAMNKGIFAATAITAILSYFLIRSIVGNLGIFWAILSGLLAGIVIGLSAEHYTSTERKPAQGISIASKTGAATNIIEGLSVGMRSTIVPVAGISAAILAAFFLSGGAANFKIGLYGIAISAVGMLSTLGITLAVDTYGPVADNAAGIAEMSSLGKKTRERAEALDAVGNTTAAIGKGFAIGSAALTSLVLFVTFTEVVGLKGIDITNPKVLVSTFIGGLLPFVFSSMLLRSVGKAAIKIVNEVRRQFKTTKGLMEGKAKPNYNKCIEISTVAALREMIAPGLLAIIIPIAIGLYLGAEALGGLLVGKVVVGFLMAVFMANSGGAWDNAKKLIESGKFGGKGSDAHKAAVTGDTVGDPFKDTAGPSLNILIKLMDIVSLVFFPLFI
ncbi:sodium-translocating pyrophosphatase [Candidatus Woesearchaeota archaeon]|nr:sodium-translocating pyrophosphatase [Candidatus Woesearchaeota archaeon]